LAAVGNCLLKHAHTPLLLRIFCSFFLFLLCSSHKNLRLLFLPGNKRDRLQTLTKCADWSQFVVDYIFFGNSTHVTAVLR